MLCFQFNLVPEPYQRLRAKNPYLSTLLIQFHCSSFQVFVSFILFSLLLYQMSVFFCFFVFFYKFNLFSFSHLFLFPFFAYFQFTLLFLLSFYYIVGFVISSALPYYLQLNQLQYQHKWKKSHPSILMYERQHNQYILY